MGFTKTIEERGGGGQIGVFPRLGRGGPPESTIGQKEGRIDEKGSETARRKM